MEEKKGFCRSGKEAIISSYFPHFGEERELVGRWGSGTIFFTNCNLLCIYCQNYQISHLGEGVAVNVRRLANIMLHLQSIGCHNINLVTPTHFVPQIVDALILAIDGGLRIPLVYNCGGYESVQTLRLLDGIIDIYMPDIKYMDSAVAERFSNAADYPEVVKEAVLQMHTQVKDLVTEAGVAKRGLLVRHLVLPNRLAQTEEVVKFLAQNVSLNTYINIMAQYRPMYKAYKYKELQRPITTWEYEEALELARKAGLKRV
jgi:putative pyruvate formate lyase activating enzyme